MDPKRAAEELAKLARERREPQAAAELLRVDQNRRARRPDTPHLGNLIGDDLDGVIYARPFEEAHDDDAQGGRRHA